MTVTVTLSDAGNYQLQAQITAIKSLITGNTNPTATSLYKVTLRQLETQLVENLLNTGKIPAAAILSGLSYGQVDTGL